ncbi:MAG: DUF11 domain-containing protein, partial [Candidatus Aminicenantes bacterium]|nr:DUF11 domain-containing protein [Candidatus Aminicenantes bacterium]
MQNLVAATGSNCQLCHRDVGGGNPWNGYGWDLRQNDRDFSAIEGLNSDSDLGGFSNFDEICVNTQPGWNADGTNLAFFKNSTTQPATPPAGIELDPMPPNQPPFANAGSDQAVNVGDTVMLDGSGSSDPDGDMLSYNWSFVSVPMDSNATLSDPTAVMPIFLADEVGNYVAQLIVNDGFLDSASDSVLISAAGSFPTSDLSITKTDSPDPVAIGENITYTLTVTNNGPSIANGVTVTDTLPVEVTFLSAISSQGACIHNGSVNGGTVTCDIGSLANVANATVTIVAVVTS